MQIDLQVFEENLPAWKTPVCHNNIASFWPLTPADNLVVAVGGRDNRTLSIPFNFRKSEFNVLQFDDKEVMVDCAIPNGPLAIKMKRDLAKTLIIYIQLVYENHDLILVWLSG